MQVKKYNVYKDSEFEWIGQVPNDWGLIRLQFCITEINQKNNPVQSEQVLSLVKDKGVMLYEEKGNVGNVAKEDISEYKLAYPNTLILNSMNILIGSVGISNYFGCVSPVYYVFKENTKSDLRFINYIFNTKEFQKELRRYANGIMEIRLRVSSHDIFKRRIPIPNKQLQIQIADYLDTQCALIDKAIEAQNKIIEKLKEYKKSIITEAVTKGLDKNAKMKDSGIEWIGKIPEGWGVRKVKFLFKVISGSTPKSDNPTFWDGDIIWITPTDYTTESKYISDSIKKITEDGLKSCSLTLVPVNSIIFSKRAPIGLVAISTKELCTNQGCLACIPINVMTSFYYYIMSIATDVFQSKGKGTTFMEISLFDFKNMRLVLPTYKEQKLIVQYLDHKTEQIDQLILSKEQIIEKLQNFKKSLIYECVTGKRRV